MTQEQLAAALGVHLMTVSKLERGKMQLTAHWLEQIAPVLQVKLEDLMSIEAATYEVQVCGAIIDGMHVVDFAEGPISQVVTDVAVNDLVSDWLIVSGSHFEPYYYDGDLIRVTYYDPEEHRFLVGRMANVLLETGESLFGIVDRHLGGTVFDIRTVKGSFIRSARVKGLGLVTAHLIDTPQKKDKGVDEEESVRLFRSMQGQNDDLLKPQRRKAK